VSTVWVSDDADAEEGWGFGCPVCDGVAFPLGRLGARVWVRCQACGMESSVPAEGWDE
jgi:hypothetical protein